MAFNPSNFTGPQLDLIAGRNAQVGQARSLGIHVQGLRELRGAFRDLDRGALRDLQKGLKVSLTPVLADARGMAPRRKGVLQASLRTFSAGNSFGIRAPVPYANVQHWGGSTGRGHKPGVPWSGATLVRPSLFISKAIDRNEDRIVNAVADTVMQHARRVGWR